MQTTNTVGLIEIEVLTPVHIGTGQKMAPNAGFVHFPHEQRVAVLDEEKVLGVVGTGQIQTWVGLIHKGESLYQWLTHGRPALRAADVARRTLHTPGALGSTTEFRPMMHTGPAGEWPYLPGSSVKGAVRTALLAAALTAEKARKATSNGQGTNWKGETVFADTHLTQGVFSANAPGVFEKGTSPKSPYYDYLRLLHVGDAHFAAGSTACLTQKIWNQDGLNPPTFSYKRIPPRNQAEMQVLLEVLPVGQKATATWQLADMLGQRAKAERVLAPPAALADFGALFTALNAHTRQLVEAELQRLPARHHDDYGAALRAVAAACGRCRAGHEAVLRVGFGSGHPFMTGDWLDLLSEGQRAAVARAARRRDGYDQFAFPKSRKLVPGADGEVGTPLGFVKLTLLTAADVLQRDAQRQAAKAEEEALEAAERAAATARAAQAAADAQRRAEAARVPEYFTGLVKEGAVVDAVYEGPDRANPKMRWFRLLLLAPGKEQRVSLALASFDVPPGTLMRVELKAVVKGKGTVQAIQNPKPKTAG